MQSPAGFLSFQGHNAMDDSFQYMDVDFSYDKDKSITLSNTNEDDYLKSLSSCDSKVYGP